MPTTGRSSSTGGAARRSFRSARRAPGLPPSRSWILSTIRAAALRAVAVRPEGQDARACRRARKAVVWRSLRLCPLAPRFCRRRSLVQQWPDLCRGSVQELATGVAAHGIAMRRAGPPGAPRWGTKGDRGAVHRQRRRRSGRAASRVRRGGGGINNENTRITAVYRERPMKGAAESPPILGTINRLVTADPSHGRMTNRRNGPSRRRLAQATARSLTRAPRSHRAKPWSTAGPRGQPDRAAPFPGAFVPGTRAPNRGALQLLPHSGIA